MENIIVTKCIILGNGDVQNVSGALYVSGGQLVFYNGTDTLQCT